MSTEPYPGFTRTTVRAWATRTHMRALRKLADTHRGEFARLLGEIRAEDPRPLPPGQPGRKKKDHG